MARRSYATQKLLDQVNALYPNRNKASDGWIGDAAHAERVSDHNPLPNGVVTAQDFTHDPNTLNCQWLADTLVQSGDPRIKYIIWNRRIWAGNWQVYTGSNPHDKHLHLSVKPPQSVYDNPTKWNLENSMQEQINELNKQLNQTNIYVGELQVQVAELTKQLDSTNGYLDKLTARVVKLEQGSLPSDGDYHLSKIE